MTSGFSRKKGTFVSSGKAPYEEAFNETASQWIIGAVDLANSLN